ncbi:MAG: GNAT family N-acetyltransferase [Acetobacteraceae bacterium]|jgi:GNAT superfamily N-acetyltransferase
MITLTDTPDPAFEAVLEDGLSRYNESKTGRSDWRALAITVQDPSTGALVGGLSGRTSLGLFFLDLFFLPENQRGTGIGSTLMRMAEEEAVRRGCRMGTLTTISFQAPEFYARHGWEEFGRIQSAPDVIRIFMRKTLIV